MKLIDVKGLGIATYYAESEADVAGGAMRSPVETYSTHGIAQGIRTFLATCSQWMSDARLVLAHHRDLDHSANTVNLETLLEDLAMAERASTVSAPPFVAAMLLPGVLHRLGRSVPGSTATVLEHDCAVCTRWRTCRAWSDGMGNDGDYRSFCPHAALLDTLPRHIGARRSV